MVAMQNMQDVRRGAELWTIEGPQFGSTKGRWAEGVGPKVETPDGTCPFFAAQKVIFGRLAGGFQSRSAYWGAVQDRREAGGGDTCRPPGSSDDNLAGGRCAGPHGRGSGC